ncbi:MAG: cytochrome P450, partial [Novosphingobium sp.]|nr:cytochrome P450 [Novosphingobium sp.]
DIDRWKDYTLAVHHGGAVPNFDLSADTDRVHSMLLELVRERRRHPRPDIASALVQGRVQGEGLPDEEALSMLSALVLGGFDTTASLITSALIWLDQNRTAHADLRSDDDLLVNAVHEFLRLWPPSLGGGRNVMRDTRLGGQTIKNGDRVLLSWAAANRDPTIFEDPHQVRLDRENASENLTFGVGPHRCLGLELAWLTGRLAIRAMLERCPDYRIQRSGLVRYRSKGFAAGWSTVPAILG